MKSLYLHDYSILGIESNLEGTEIILLLISAEGKIKRICFKQVVFWSLSSFETQNVLFDINIYIKGDLSYTKGDLLTELLDDYEVHEYYRDFINNHNYFFYELDPSVGMGEFIIAKSVETIDGNE